ncbi:hypothetical protein [Pseudaestuariivita sp.]|uniref:hypothetical protein n=1 Tax=Pseudaestuariivita sp. TaxID=2211669 RepID=UPI00405870D2
MTKTFFKPALWGAFVLTNLASFVGTGLGLGFILNAAWDQDPRVAYAVAFLISSMIQALLSGFWMQASDRIEGTLRRMLWLSLGLSMTLLSATLATGFWTWTLGLDEEVARVRTAQSATTVTGPLRDFADRYAQISTGFDDLSVTMIERRQTEYDNGDSCDGPAVQTGPGPRTRLADRLQGEAATRRDIAQALADDAFDMAVVPAGADDAMLRTLLRDADALTRDRRARDLRGWANGLVAQFEGEFTDPSTGAVFTCPSSAVVTDLRAIVAMIDAPPGLPTVSPIATEDGLDTAVRSSFRQSWQILGWLALGWDEPDQDILDVTGPAVGFALTNEALIILCAILLGLLRGRQSPQAPGGNEMTPTQREETLARVTAWTVLYMPGRTPAFLVPVGGKPEATRMAEAEVYRWRMPPLADEVAVDFAMQAPDAHAELQNLTGARRFRAYVVPRRATAWYRQAAVDLQDSLRSA